MDLRLGGQRCAAKLFHSSYAKAVLESPHFVEKLELRH
jgi:hypothetical protein